jgi:hypothetical protein
MVETERLSCSFCKTAAAICLLALLGLGGCSRNGPVSFPFSTLHVTFGVKLLLLQQSSQ